MRNSYNLQNLQPGDRLVLPKNILGIIQHHVIYIGLDDNGCRLYIENYLGKGVQVISERHLFRDGYVITRIEPFTGSTYQRQEAVKRAMQLIGKPYDLVNFNCEHYANTVQHNKNYSNQVSNGAALAFLGLIFGIGFME